MVLGSDEVLDCRISILQYVASITGFPWFGLGVLWSKAWCHKLKDLRGVFCEVVGIMKKREYAQSHFVKSANGLLRTHGPDVQVWRSMV